MVNPCAADAPGTLVIRADAGPDIGTGHVMRMHALAQGWTKAGGNIHFVGAIHAPDLLKRMQDEGSRHAAPPAVHPDPEDLECLLRHSAPGDWVALDGYHFDTAYMHAVRAAGRKLLVVDDICDRDVYAADIYLNQNLGAQRLPPAVNPDALRLVGVQYALLRREFTTVPPRPCARKARRILVTFGGSDPHDESSKALQSLALLNDPELDVTVVYGAASAAPRADWAAALPGQTQVLNNVEDMSRLMAKADLALCAAGSTCWELCRCGVPMLLRPIADNQMGIASELESLGVAIRVGDNPAAMAPVLGALIHDLPARTRMARAGQELVDGQGALRVVEAMLGGRAAASSPDARLWLRPLRDQDRDTVFRWRNTPFIVMRSAHRNNVAEDEHQRWFQAALHDPDRLLRIISLGSEPIGLLGLARAGGACTLTVYLEECQTARGFGVWAIQQGVSLARQCLGEANVHAQVREDNAPALRAFLKAGFTLSPQPVPNAPHLLSLTYNHDDRSAVRL